MNEDCCYKCRPLQNSIFRVRAIEMPNNSTKKREEVAAATDDEWAKFQEFLGGDEDQADGDVDETKSSSQKTADDSKETTEEQIMSKEQQAKADYEEEMTQAAYGARVASLLMERQKLFNRKKGPDFTSVPLSQQNLKEDTTKSMYLTPSLAFDEDNISTNRNEDIKNEIGKHYLHRMKRQKVDSIEAIDELDWRYGT